MKIAKIGDEIHWQTYGISYSDWVNGEREFALFEYKSKVTMIDTENKEYGVYCFYGNDRIPFDDVIKIIHKK